MCGLSVANTLCRVTRRVRSLRRQRENIARFLRGIRAVGIEEHNCFETVDLFDAKNPAMVVQCLLALKRITGDDYAPPPADDDDDEPYVDPRGSQGQRAAPRGSLGDVSAAARLADAATFVASRTGKPFRGLTSHASGDADYGPFVAWLHDGTVLCAVANALQPGIVPTRRPSDKPFEQARRRARCFCCCCVPFRMRRRACGFARLSRALLGAVCLPSRVLLVARAFSSLAACVLVDRHARVPRATPWFLPGGRGRNAVMAHPREQHAGTSHFSSRPIRGHNTLFRV